MRKFIVLFFLLLPLGLSAQQDPKLSALLGGMVESDRWLIHKDNDTEEFIGNLYYSNDNYTIKADYGLSDRRRQTYKIKGNVFASQKLSGTVAEVKADEVFYNRKKDTGYIKPKKGNQIDIMYKLPDNTMRLYADRADFEKKASLFTATGYAELHDLNNTLYSDKMSYNILTGVFIASGGRPVLWGFTDDGDYALQADTIEADTKGKIFKASGRVTGWITSAQDLSNLNKGKNNGTEIK